jgi:hypothetical protein
MIESNVGIICACLPHLKPFLRRYAPRLLSSSADSHDAMNQAGVASNRAEFRLSTTVDSIQLSTVERYTGNAPLTAPHDGLPKHVNGDDRKTESVCSVRASDHV